MQLGLNASESFVKTTHQMLAQYSVHVDRPEIASESFELRSLLILKAPGSLTEDVGSMVLWHAVLPLLHLSASTSRLDSKLVEGK